MAQEMIAMLNGIEPPKRGRSKQMALGGVSRKEKAARKEMAKGGSQSIEAMLRIDSLHASGRRSGKIYQIGSLLAIAVRRSKDGKCANVAAPLDNALKTTMTIKDAGERSKVFKVVQSITRKINKSCGVDW